MSRTVVYKSKLIETSERQSYLRHADRPSIKLRVSPGRTTNLRSIHFLFLGLFIIHPIAHAQLPLEEAIRQAVKNSPEVRMARTEMSRAQLLEPSLLALTDPVFGTSFLINEDNTPRESPGIQGASSKRQSLDIFVKQDLLTGTESRIFYSLFRDDTPSLFRALNPSYDARIGVDLKQPLLKNFWGRPDKIKRQIAQKNLNSSALRFRQAQDAVAARMAFAYLKAWVSDQVVRVQEKSLIDAKRLWDKTNEKWRYGLVEKAELLQTEAAYNVKKIERDSGLSELKQALFDLSLALHFSTLTIKPGDLVFPSVKRPERTSVDSMLVHAIQNRADLAALKADIEEKELNTRLEKLRSLPDLSLVGSYVSEGLRSKEGNANHNALEFRDESWTGGINFLIPFSGRKEKIQYKISELELERSQADYDRLLETTNSSILASAEKIELANKRMTAYAELLSLQEKKYSAEEKNFQNGKSTTDLLVRSQSDIYQAQVQLLKARADELAGWAELLYVTGDFLPKVFTLIKTP